MPNRAERCGARAESKDETLLGVVMKRIRVAAFLIWFAVPIVLLAQDKPVDAPAIDVMVEGAMKSWQVPGVSVAIVKDDKVVFIKGYGVRELGKDAPVSPDTLFAIASCTKAFASTSVAMLVDDGIMNWDDPVRKHLHYFRLSDPPADALVTLRDLMCHRTGLSRHDLLGFSAGWSQEETVKRIGLVKLNRPFRSNWEYNNIMFQATGLSVAAAAKMDWDAFLKQRIFTPLGMDRTTARNTVAMKDSDYARPHIRPVNEPAELVPWRPYENSAAGSIVSSANDMAKWVRFQLGNGTYDGKRLLSKANLDEMHTPQMVVRFSRSTYPDTDQCSYGLGWFIHDHRGHHLLSHTGGLEGYRSRVVLVPKQKLGIVVLSNSGAGDSAASMHYVVSNTLLDMMLGLPAKDWNAHYTKAYQTLASANQRQRAAREKSRVPDTRPTKPLPAYVGTYENPAYGLVTIAQENDQLQLKWGIYRCRMDHFHYDTFTAHRLDVKPRPGTEQVVVFNLDADGTVNQLKMFGQEFVRSKKPS